MLHFSAIAKKCNILNVRHMKKYAVWGIIVIILFGAIISISYSRFHHIDSQTISSPITSSMIITSPLFEDGALIPAKFSCDGGDFNPELLIQNVPEEAKTLALIVDDTDATRGGTFTHWLVWNIDPKTSVIKEESTPPKSVEGTNDFGHIGYGGPCPPKGSKPHHYHFRLFALNVILNLESGANKSVLESEIQKHVIAETELIGLYGRK